MFEEASEFPLTAQTIAGHESLENLKQEYISNTDFFCHGMLRAMPRRMLANVQ
jgi:hypothetical protein